MPETYRYQRLARTRIAGCPQWGVRSRGKNMRAIAHGIIDPMAQGTPGGWPGSGLTAITTYIWRVLWWSLPKASRKEH
eukprot:81858-Lingulodinium_polyedra.AAC.1